MGIENAPAARVSSLPAGVARPVTAVSAQSTIDLSAVPVASIGPRAATAVTAVWPVRIILGRTCDREFFKTKTATNLHEQQAKFIRCH